MADGCIRARHRLEIVSSKRDKSHLQELADYICLTKPLRENRDGNFLLTARNVEVIPRLRCQFDLHVNKTYHPPSKLPPGNDNLFVSYVIGFIDGDGNIQMRGGGRTDCFIRIKLHSSWLRYLAMLHDRVCGLLDLSAPVPKINGCGYAELCWHNMKIVRYLATQSQRLDLPSLRRKWSKIDTTRISRYEQAEVNKEAVTVMLRAAYSVKEMASKLQLSDSAIYRIINRNNLRKS